MEKQNDEIFCPYCAKPIKNTAVVCPYCGSQVKELKVSNQVAVKSKSVAVVLAVFFSFWSWLYTYGKNSVKFWVFGIFSVIALFYSPYAVSQYPDKAILFSIGLPIFYVGTWIYSIVDNAIKPYSFFIDYPNK